MDTQITVDPYRVMREISESLDIASHANEIICMIERLLPKIDKEYYLLLAETSGFVRPEDEPKTQVQKLMMACHWLVLMLNASNISEQSIIDNDVRFANYNGRFDV